MSSTDKQGSSLGSFPTSPPLYPHFNRPSGFWPCVKSCLVGGSDKYSTQGFPSVLFLVIEFRKFIFFYVLYFLKYDIYIYIYIILEGVRAKNIQATLLFVEFTKAFDSIHRGKMEQMLLAYGLPKETVAALTILYRNTKVKVRSPDGDTEYFDIVAGVLQGDTLASYLFIICLDYVLKTSIDKIRENGFELTKKRSRRYPAKTITDADYADDIAILANTPNQAETLLHSLERAAAGIGLYINAHKTEYMCYNQTGDISTLDGTPLKLVDKFTYLGSSVESTEKDIDTRLTKALTIGYRLYGNQT